MTPDADLLAVRNLDLVHNLARRFRLPPQALVDQDDLVSVGYIALLRCARRYQPGRHVDFRVYAARRIKGAMVDELRDTSAVSRKYWQRGDRVTVDSLDRSVLADGEAIRVGDTIPDPKADVAATVENRERLSELLHLPPRRREALLRHAAGETLREIGLSWGVTAARVQQVMTRRGTRLRNDSPDGLTPRELQVLHGAAHGESGPETAARLHLSVWTIHSHRRTLLKRLGARNITHAVWLSRDRLEAP